MKIIIIHTPYGFYLQVGKLTSVSPAGPFLADLWIHLFESAFQERTLKLFYGHIDDILCVFQKEVLEKNHEPY